MVTRSGAVPARPATRAPRTPRSSRRRRTPGPRDDVAVGRLSAWRRLARGSTNAPSSGGGFRTFDLKKYGHSFIIFHLDSGVWSQLLSIQRPLIRWSSDMIYT